MPHLGGHIGGSPPGTWYQSLPGWQEVRWPDAGGQGRTPASQRHSPYGRKRIGTVKPPTVKLSRGSAGAGLPRPPSRRADEPCSASGPVAQRRPLQLARISWQHPLMTDQPSHGPTPSTGAKSLRMVVLSSETLSALLDGDLSRASAEAGVEFTDYFVTDKARRLWQRRLAQLATDPESQKWIARAVVDETQEVVVGHAGYHGPPDKDGMVEIGYSVDVAYRRRGYARAMLRELLRRANTDPRVKTVRATISPDNVAFLATIQGFGFTQTGEQWDEEDGLELVFEIALEAPCS